MEKRLGVYIHIPFCVSKCAYCDFYSVTGRDKLMDEYLEAVTKHIREYTPQLKGYYIDTVYFGGGTPSYFGAARLIEVLETLKRSGKVLIDAEVTAEMNPESTLKADLIKMRKAGFNRISLGMQSANDEVLVNLGRRHNIARVEEAIADAREAGFKNINIDLMYGLPSQSKDDWTATLAKAVSMKPDHISCYGLKLEEGTPLYIFHDTPFIPDDDVQADMYLFAVDYLAQFGLKQYEISNFARRGYESKHNLKYWRGQEYIGFGPAAHSYIGDVRYSNVANVEKYCLALRHDEPVVENREYISGHEKISEYIMLAMRTTDGISAEEYKKYNAGGFDALEERLQKYKDNGWADTQNGKWYFTPKGFLVSNILIGDLLEVQTKYRTSQIRKLSGESALSPASDEKIKRTVVPVFKGI